MSRNAASKTGWMNISPGKKKAIIWVFSLILCTMLVYILSFSHSTRSNSKMERTYKITRVDIKQSLQLSGKIVPDKMMVITPQQSGRIISFAVREGSKVEEDDILFTMKLESDGQGTLLEKQAQVKLLEVQLKNTEKLVQQRSSIRDLIGSVQISKEEYDLEKLRMQLVSAREQLSLMENSLGMSGKGKANKKSIDSMGFVSVKSPIKGIVTLIDKRPGDFVLGGGGLASTEVGGANERMVMVVADLSQLLVKTRVMESDLRFVKKDSPIKIRLDAFPDTSYDGIVNQIGGQGRTEVRAGYTYFDVLVSINHHDSKLLPEMNATVDLTYEDKQKVPALPVSTVLMLPKGSFVKKKDPGPSTSFSIHPIKTGIFNYDFVEILEGLSDSDEVLEMDFASPEILRIIDEN